MSVLLKANHEEYNREAILESLGSVRNVTLVCGDDSAGGGSVDVSGPLLACHSTLVRSLAALRQPEEEQLFVLLPDFRFVCCRQRS